MITMDIDCHIRLDTQDREHAQVLAQPGASLVEAAALYMSTGWA